MAHCGGYVRSDREAVFAHIPQTRFQPIDGDSAAIEFGREATDFDVD
jgi:hypothetical protein